MVFRRLLDCGPYTRLQHNDLYEHEALSCLLQSRVAGTSLRKVTLRGCDEGPLNLGNLSFGKGGSSCAKHSLSVCSLDSRTSP